MIDSYEVDGGILVVPYMIADYRLIKLLLTNVILSFTAFATQKGNHNRVSHSLRVLDLRFPHQKIDHRHLILAL